MFELARLHVAHLYSECQDVLGSSAQLQRILQFVVIADLEGLGIRSVVSLASHTSEYLLLFYQTYDLPGTTLATANRYSRVAWKDCRTELPWYHRSSVHHKLFLGV